MKKFTQKILLSTLLCFCIAIVSAQQRNITGTIKDANGVPIENASVLVKGTTKGVATNAAGNFSVPVNGAKAILQISSVNFQSKEVTIGQSNSLDITLEGGTGTMQEVVVTALGIKRAKKSLGYAVQEVKGQTLVDARETNLVNTLSGQVAGLQVVRSSNGPAGSSKIILRGNNSLTGSNQPLIVVDGVPVDNFTGADNNDYWYPSLDMGNGLSDINADDIESMSVLKGPSAAALYGSRAGNGVILITTKTGKRQNGLGLSVSSSLGVESIFTNPKMQNVFGQGKDGIFDDRSTLSWGPKAAGQSIVDWTGKSVPMHIYNNVDNYFDQGINSNQSVSFQQQFNGTSIYTSFNHLDDKSMIPGTKLTRDNLMARAVSKFGKDNRWTTDTKIQYSNANAVNRPIGGNNSSNSFFTLYMQPRSLDIRQFNPPVDEFGNMIWYGGSSQANPYWINQYDLNQDIRNRFIMNGSIKYDFTSWLNAEIKGGTDMYFTNTEGKTYSGGPITSSYSSGKRSFTETNYSALVSAKKDNLFDRLGGNITVGGNLMSQEFSSLSANSGLLKVPNLFSLNNGVSYPTIDEGFNQRKINSVYGSVQFNWDSYLYLDATFRNDWSSTLSKINRSFFYPSLSLSYVFTDMMEKMGSRLPSWVSYGKLRASYATVGNDLPAYKLYNTYGIGKDPNGNTTAYRNPVLLDPNVRSELIKSYEVGAEMRFLESRLGFDVSLYKSNATRQLIDLPMDPLSGYSARKINAGDIQNSGVELMIDGRILNNPGGINWNMTVNYSTNNNKVNALADGVTQYPLGGYDDVKVLAVVGEKYGEIYGTRFKRVNDDKSPYNGQLLLDATGLPQKADGASVKLGNQQANALLGVTNTFTYKNFSLSFLFDGRFGGKIFSGTNAGMQQNGTSSVTVINGDRKDMIVEGVILNAANEYEKNTLAVSPQKYWNKIATTGNMGITEANIYDATNVRLRHLQVGYELPRKLIAKTPLQRARVSVSCNNVWLITSHMNGIDPESVFATGTNATGFENASAPTSRTILFNLSLNF